MSKEIGQYVEIDGEILPGRFLTLEVAAGSLALLVLLIFLVVRFSGRSGKENEKASPEIAE